VKNTYKSILEGSGDWCRGGDWGKDGARWEGRSGRRLGQKGMVRGHHPGGNRIVVGDCSDPTGSIFIGCAITVG
jgi:hypothetical protein